MGYEGDWVMDPSQFGLGSFTSENGTVWTGQWKDCLLNGPGKITFKDGSVEEGTFKDGELEGIG